MDVLWAIFSSTLFHKSQFIPEGCLPYPEVSTGTHFNGCLLALGTLTFNTFNPCIVNGATHIPPGYTFITELQAKMFGSITLGGSIIIKNGGNIVVGI